MFCNCLRNLDGKTCWCKQCMSTAGKANSIKKKTRLLSQIQENQNYNDSNGKNKFDGVCEAHIARG